MKKGFTLVELLVVLVILLVLVGITVPVYTRITERGRATACVSNLRQLGIALNLYLNDNNQTMPPLAAGRTSMSQDVPVIDNTLNAYAANPAVFACPSDFSGIASATGTSYYWNSALSGQRVANLNFLAIADATRIPVLGDKQAFHPYAQNKVNILYADGHATQDLKFFTSQ
ncbi:MAG TPA: prepilin-type N-terminal cleavage/methylation domain-containing protein [Chthoniobacteraceae bacterium]|nr:prepilin-type N-terminal cleavage/methylation domain-containing protein [Chthoniobacteraceae bacterium]